MARQLVFTSAPQGLTPGRTGYCTVARHRDLRERLVPLLESSSTFPSDWQPPPVICSFRMVDVGGTRFPVLSRIVDAGYDYTHRGHYLAHHLILDPQEIDRALPPADIFLRWNGWLSHWEGPPRWLTENDWVDLTNLPAAPLPALPAITWKELTGDGGKAALLLDGVQPGNRVLRCPAGQENRMLSLLRESSALLPAVERWRAEFTTCLQSAESGAGFRWVAVRADSPMDASASRSGNVLDLTQPEKLPPAPTNAAARIARGEARLTPGSVAVAAAPDPSKNNLEFTPLILPEQAAAGPAKTPLPPAKTKSGANRWILVTVAGLVAGGLAALILLWPQSPPAPPPPAPVNAPTIAPTMPPPPTAVAAPANNPSMASEQALLEIESLAQGGSYFEALAKWRDFAVTSPDLARARGDLLQNQLLPGARKKWLDQVGEIAAQLDTARTPRADLAAQLADLQKIATLWPFARPGEMTAAAKSVADKIHFLDQLPGDPVWIVDNFKISAKGEDYQDATAMIAIPELSAMLGSAAGKFKVSAVGATSLALPPAAQWFNFSVGSGDFESASFLILNDSTQGKAGGRFMELVPDSPGVTRLTWRLFTPDSDFVQSYPANAPLGPVSQELWVHFSAAPPLPSFYLLLRRPDNTSYKSWTALRAPLEWLAVSGSPAKVALPPWLRNNLTWRSSGGQTFSLVPANLNAAAGSGSDQDLKPGPTLAEARYDAANLVNRLNAKVRDAETTLNQTQSQLQDLQTAMNGPVGLRPPQTAVDQTADTVKKIQSDMTTAGAAARAAAQPDWPGAVAPWMLTFSLSSKDSLTLVQFTR